MMLRLVGVRPGISLMAALLATVSVGLVSTDVAEAAPAAASTERQGVTWVEEEVSFTAGEVTVYGTYRHPVGAGARQVPAALLIAGSGSTDRDGNTAAYQNLNTLRTLAEWLSEEGVASLRYDKLGSGETGLGPYADNLADIGLEVFEQEAASALSFLADQPEVDCGQLTVIGHSEGALYALLLKSGHSGQVPAIRSLGLLEPLSRRYMDVLADQITASLDAQVEAGLITQEIADQVIAVMEGAIAELRTSGTVAEGLPYGLASVFNPTNAKYLAEADQFDPADLAADLRAGTPVLVSCSDADIQVSCEDVAHLRSGLWEARAKETMVWLHGVNHVLKEDDSLTSAYYNDDLPFSHELRAAFRRAF